MHPASGFSHLFARGRRGVALAALVLAVVTPTLARADDPVTAIPEKALTYSSMAMRPVEPTPIVPPAPARPAQTAVIAAEVRRWSETYQLDPLLVWAIIEAESGGNPRAVNRVGALGLMQVMPGHFTAEEDPFDIPTNIKRGTAILAADLNDFGSVRLALAAYNAGGGAVHTYRGVPPYEETQRYVRSVLGRYEQLLAQAVADTAPRAAAQPPAGPPAAVPPSTPPPPTAPTDPGTPLPPTSDLVIR